MNKLGLTPFELLSRQIDECNEIDERQRIELKLKSLNKFIKWTDKDYLEYGTLLANLKRVRRKSKPSTSELGKALEDIVDFIFNKSFIYKVHSNKRSSTHEIDQFIVLSDRGIQTMHSLGISRELLPTTQHYFLGECKNYKKPVGATWVGKFNTLMEVSGKCQLGIIFSCGGLTGKEQNWENSHGLTKVIHYLSDPSAKRYILDFNMGDFDLLNENRTISVIDIIKSKKRALEGCLDSQKLLEDQHDGYHEVKSIFDEIKQ
ncbi:acetylglutamate semialdehyde dehydrogenase [Paraclostridium bifermentans]|uniref:Acetylglutamate semialdehyde dehydrogenase n=1 Tax=Paraclostridium bifermentans TaxID=1490 RepID=A0A5P3XF42_PARBF|nr:acetylglutamate semialdehyde dehydrogenase [Paraclostridium bifermentans]QEZ68951.1 acetylglutamate semialdehyde dehydrogenase [Paraclostridium bifermentans]